MATKNAEDLPLKERLSPNEPTEDEPMLSKKEPPVDVANLVYFIVLLNGIGVLIPWNMFITIAPQYFVAYWFTPNGNETEYGKNFMSSLGIASQFPNLSVNVINILLVIGGPLIFRIVGPLILNTAILSIVIGMIALTTPNFEGMGTFYYGTLVLVALLNMSNGVYQNSIFGLVADFPAKYSNAIILGNNICGLFTTVLHMVVTLLLPNQIKTIAIIYFSISLAVLILCGVSLTVLSQKPFYKYYITLGQAAREADTSQKPGIRQIVNCVSECWPQLLSVFLTFFVTLTIFPAMMAATPLYLQEGQNWHSIWPESIYVTVTTFLSFNLFAVFGSTAAGFYQWPKPNLLIFPVIARALLIVFFAFCNYRPSDRTFPVYFTSEWMFTAMGAFMSFTHGYFSSLGMMYAPRVVSSSMAKTAGMVSALCLIGGLFAGVAFTFVVAAFIKSSF